MTQTIPTIGITGTSCRGKHKLMMAAVAIRYVEAVRRGGALPLVIPPDTPTEHIPALFDRIDGLVLSGGGDISPSLYGGEDSPAIHDVIPQRDTLEIALTQAAVERGLPFLGICRGIQVLNVALGGDLYTDIDTQTSVTEKHNRDSTNERTLLAHKVEILPSSRLAQILGGTEFEVNSLHHQSIRKLANRLKVVARSPEGIVEGVEVIGHPFGIAVQWHPEWMEQDHPAMQALFRALAEAAKRKAER